MFNSAMKVLVSGHDLKFWRPLQAHLLKTGLFEFREDEWSGHNTHDPKSTMDGIEWADIIIAEWMLGNAVFCSQNRKEHQRLIIRLHLQERGTDFPSQINYDNVDHIVFVGPHIQDECIRRFNIPPRKTSVIGNFLDHAKYQLPKLGGAEFNIGIIGTAPSRKRLDLALDTLEILLSKDDRYMLHVKGASPASYKWLWNRPQERSYYERVYTRINSSNILRHNVIFDPPGNDVHYWLQKIGYIISPSDFESFHMAVAEGASSCAIPIVWNWEGAASIYPLLELVDSPQSAANLIQSLCSSNSRSRLASQSSNFIKERYSASVIASKWTKLLKSSIDSAPTAPTNTITRPYVLVVYTIDKWETFHRREMLEALARHIRPKFNVLIIEPGTDYQALLAKQMCSKEQLNHYAQLKPYQVSENIYRIRILLSGFPSDVKTHDNINPAGGCQNAIQVAAREIFGQRVSLIHWIYKPNQKENIPLDQDFIYEVYDEYTMDFSTGLPIQDMVEMEPDVLASAKHVFFTSKPLADRKKHNCTAFSIVGNGVDFDAFDAFRLDFRDEQPMMRPSVGYLGNLSNFFDWHLMLDVVDAMQDIDFFFHGQVEFHRLDSIKDTVFALMSRPNTYFSGRVSRPVGAAAINRYDALIIPFVVNDAMHAVNPLKLWEYFAVGKPVVMTEMDAVSWRQPGLFTAKNSSQFVEMLYKAFLCDEKVKQGLVQTAKSYSWLELTRNHLVAFSHL